LFAALLEAALASLALANDSKGQCARSNVPQGFAATVIADSRLVHMRHCTLLRTSGQGGCNLRVVARFTFDYVCQLAHDHWQSLPRTPY